MDAARPDSSRPWPEAAALLLLMGCVPLLVVPPAAVVAWVAGLVCLVLSRRWTVLDKVIGLVLAGFAPAIPALALVNWGDGNRPMIGSLSLWTGVLWLWLAAAIVATAWLIWRLRTPR